MNETVLTTIAFTGFTVAFFHAAIPTHWLPFVAAGRAQGWTHSKTLLITALAGTGHVLATALLGLILTIFGVALSSRIGTWFPRIAGALLIGLGLFYIWRQLSGHAHSHTHLFSKSGHQHEHELRESLAHFRGPDISRTRTSDWVAISSLFAMLTFSPCEAFLPLYVSGIRFGWGGFALLTLILSTAAVAGMLVFTWLALIGIRGIGLSWFERYESLVMGSLLLLVGVMVLVFEK
jgi:nickel/cobalt exporter